MSNLLFANNASTTLAGAITNVATTANLASGTGVLFPSPTAGQYFVLTFTDAATGLINEIVWVTNVTGDVITMTRAQEGTTGKAWNSGDFAANLWTAGQAASIVQVSQLQAQAGNYAADSGSVNAIAVTLNPVPASLASLLGSPIRVKVSNTTTSTTPTLTINGLTATTIVNPNGTVIGSGQIVSGAVATFAYDGTSFQLTSVMSPATYIAPYFTDTVGAWTRTIPSGVTTAKVTIGGGGGGGGGCITTQAGGAGGGGDVCTLFLTGLVPAQVLSGTIGDGGLGGSAGANSGANGGNTTLLNNSVLVATANYGALGIYNVAPAGGIGGVVTIGTFSGTYIDFPGGYGTDGSPASNVYGGNGAPGWNGTGLGRSGFGGGKDAVGHCAGGGAAYGSGSYAGGKGSKGFVLIEWDAV